MEINFISWIIKTMLKFQISFNDEITTRNYVIYSSLQRVKEKKKAYVIYSSLELNPLHSSKRHGFEVNTQKAFCRVCNHMSKYRTEAL